MGILGASTPAFTVSADSLSTITDTIVANVAVVAPWGIGVIAIVAGVRFVPKLIKMFAKG